MSVAIRGNVAVRGNVWAGQDLVSDLNSFIATTGATDTQGLINLVTYLRKQGLWDSVRFFPFKSAQNKGSGTTVYGLGGWTSNNVTLVNGPTWGAAGVAFDATDDRATWDGTGIEGLSELYCFDVQKPAAASAPNAQNYGPLSFGDLATERFFLSNVQSGLLENETIAAGIQMTLGDIRRIGTLAITWSTGALTQVVNRFAQTGTGFWQSKTSAVLITPYGTNDYRPSQVGWSTNSILNINCARNGAGYAGFVPTTRVALLLCKTSLTQAQREAITDYLDAL